MHAIRVSVNSQHNIVTFIQLKQRKAIRPFPRTHS